MLTTLTSWLRPSADRKPRRKTALRPVERLEDRAVPDATPYVLATGPYAQAWAGGAVYNTSYTGPGQESVEGFNGAGLTPTTVGNAGTITAFGPGSLTLDLNGAQALPAALPGPGIALFRGATAPIANDAVIGLKPGSAATASPFLLFHLDTQNVGDVFTTFRVRDIDTSANATQTLSLQYRVGNAGPFIPLRTIADATTGADLNISERLPAAASFQPLVQVRIITTFPVTGPAEWVGVDDVTFVGNQAPTVATSASVTIVDEAPGIGTTGAGIIDPGINVTDNDQSNLFDIVTGTPGRLTVTILNPQFGDSISINDQGGGPTAYGNIDVQGTNVVYYTPPTAPSPPTPPVPNTIGTISPLSTPTNLIVNLLAPASVDALATTATAIRALSRQILFNTTTDTPNITVTRTVQFSVDDGRGGSASGTQGVQVRDRNDIPTLVTGPALGTVEEVPIALTDPRVGDVDILGGTLVLTVEVLNTGSGVGPGTLTFTGGGPIPTGSGSALLTLEGTVGQINGAIAGGQLVFVPAPNFNTDSEPNVVVRFTLTDQGFTGLLPATGTAPPITNGYPNTVTATLSIDVDGRNDPPAANVIGFVSTLAAPAATLDFTLPATPPAPLTIADILAVATSTGTPVSLSGASLSGGGMNYTLLLPAPLPAGSYTVTVRASNRTTVSAPIPAPAFDVPFTAPAAPPGGALALWNLVEVIGPSGSPVSLTGATLAGTGTSYTITFPDEQPAGAYTVSYVVPVAALVYPLSSPTTVLLFGSNAVLSEPDFPKSPDLAGGTLRVQALTNGAPAANNQLRLRSEGNGPGQIFLQGTNVNYVPVGSSPVTIGNITSGGVGSAPLVIAFANAPEVTPAAVQAVLRNVTYSTGSFDTTPRVIRFNLTDGDGVSTTVAASTPTTVLYADADTFVVLIPQPLNNAPSFTIPGSPVTLTANEDAGTQTAAGFAANLSPGPASYEAGQTLTFLLSNDNTALFGTQPAISPTGELTYTPALNAFGAATVTVRLMDNGGTANNGVDTSAPQTFTITLNPVNDKPTFTAANPPAVNEDAGPQTVAGWATGFVPGPSAPLPPNESAQTLVAYTAEVLTNPGLFAAAPAVSPAGVLTYTAAANAFGTATFRVRVQDSGGVANGGVDLSDWQTFTVTVNAVNDDPVLGGLVTVPYLTGQTAKPIAAAGTVVDDTPDFGGGFLQVSITSGVQAGDALAVGNLGPVTVSGVTVSHAGTPVGTLSGTATNITITFNASATVAVVQDVLRAVVFSTTAPSGDRGLTVLLGDGDGGSVTATLTVDVADEVTVVAITKTSPAAAVAGPSLTWRLTSDLPVSNFSPSNFALVGSEASSVTDPLTVQQIDATTVEITATISAPVQGTLGLNLVNETGLTVGILNLPPDFVGGVYNVDRVGPTVDTVTNTDGDGVVPVGQPFTYTVTFTEDVLDGTFTAADVANAGTAPVSFGAITETTPGTFTVVVTPTGAGTVVLQVPAAADVQDVLGNDNPANFVDATTLTVDAVAPTVVSFANNTASAPPNVTAPGTTVLYTVTFSEDISVASLVGAFSVAPGGATATVGMPSRVASGVVTVPVTPSTTGAIRLVVTGVRDVAGNPMAGPETDAVTVTSNRPPTPQADSYTVGEDGGLFTSPPRGVLANDTDPNDAATTLTADTPAIQLPTKGTLVLRADGTFDYTPSLNASGTDTFQYRVRDPFGGTALATATITITPVNDPPTFVITAPTVTVFEDSGLSTGTQVLGSILPGPAGEAEAISAANATANRPDLFSVQPTITLTTLGSGERVGLLRFTPAPNQFGTATVTVRVIDAGSGIAPNANFSEQTFDIVINPVNDAPTLRLTNNPPVSAEDGGPQTVLNYASFEAGPSEAGQGQTAIYTTTVLGTTNGLTFSAAPAIDTNGTLTYQAATNATGTATVRVALRDSGGTANGGVDVAPFTQSFTIVVRAQNDLPVANPDGSLIPAGANATFINVLANDTPDPDGSEVLTVVSVTQPGRGTAAVAPGGRGVLYTPAPGFTGTETFTYTINDGNGGPATSTVTVTVRPVPAGQPLFDVIAVGTGPGGGPVVRVNSLSSGAFTATFAAYDQNFRGGVNVAVGDVNGDGVPDVVATPGPGGGPHVKVIDGSKLGLVDPATNFIADAAVLASFFAYSPTFSGGVTVVVADMNGDGLADIVTGTGSGGGAHVKVISGAALSRLGNLGDGQVNPGAVIGSFFAYDSNFRGGVNVAAGDVNGDGIVDVITTPGAGGGSHVKVFSGMGGPILQSYFAYTPSFFGGVNISAGDVNGDGRADVITGAGIGGGPHVKVFDSRGGEVASFLGLTGRAAGADVAFRVTRDGTPLVVVGGQSGGSQVKTYAAPGYGLFNEFDAFEPTFLGGVEVG